MSSSLRKRVSPSSPEGGSLADLPCAECGKEGTVKQTRGNYRFADGTMVRNLSYFRCSNCRAAFFDLAAMKEIRKQRASKVPPMKSLFHATGKRPKGATRRASPWTPA
jgi:hypothetical protein